MNNQNQEEVIRLTKAWVEHFVIALGLCPFAQKPFIEKRIRFTVCTSSSREEIKAIMMSEALQLLASTNKELETTLVICPEAPAQFEAFLDVAWYLEDAFYELGYEGILQIATFHPRYRFADSLANDPADYTNRAPFPIFHILREASVTDAVDSYKDIDIVPERNCKLLRTMGMDEILRILKGLS
jgi:uncharacterized protein